MIYSLYFISCNLFGGKFYLKKKKKGEIWCCIYEANGILEKKIIRFLEINQIEASLLFSQILLDFKSNQTEK